MYLKEEEKEDFNAKSMITQRMYICIIYIILLYIYNIYTVYIYAIYPSKGFPSEIALLIQYTYSLVYINI